MSPLARCLVVLGLAVALPLGGLPGCADDAPRRTLTPSDRGPLPVEIEALLFGEDRVCRDGEDCPSGQCLYGFCSGLTRADEPWRTELVVDRIEALLEGEPGIRATLNGFLAKLVLGDDLSMPTRARLLLALARLGGAPSLSLLAPSYDDFPPALQDALALALARHGEATHLGRVLALTESDRPGVAIEALRALGGLTSLRDAEDLALVHGALLGVLHGDVTHEAARAALDATVRLAHPRAIRPLIALLSGGPEALRDPAAAGLMAMTQQALGLDVPAWQRWADGHGVPPGWAFTPRELSPIDDIGLPAP